MAFNFEQFGTETKTPESAGGFNFESFGIEVEPIKKTGFFKSVAQDIAQPFGRVAATAVGKPVSIFGRENQPIEPIIKEGGLISPEGKLQQPFNLRGLGQAVGTGAQIASNIPVVRGVTAPIQLGLKGLVGAGVKAGIREGAVGGGLFAGGRALEEGKSALETAWETAKGTVGGAVAGGIFGGVTSGGIVAIKAFPATISKLKLGLFGRAPVNNVDDVLRQADKTLRTAAQTLEATERATAKPSLRERWAGISNDIKNRIAGKHDQLKEYFDVSHARNNFDTLPTPLEYAATKVNAVVDQMGKLLNDVGSQIGRFRKKIGTFIANPDQLAKIEGSFIDELGKLNLEVVNGILRQMPGTVQRIGAQGDIKVLQNLYKNLLTTKQGRNLERLFDLRNLFDSEINFAKQAREVSDVVDPLARSMRKKIASVGAEIVGKLESKNLAKYADFIDAYNQLRGFTERRAGAEFLLKQVLSERARMPRELMNAIKDATGIDLMDDAVMAHLATELIGNTRQMGLFRQEITKAGLDVASLITGKTSGAIDLLFKAARGLGTGKVERRFLEAAKQAKPPRRLFGR